MEGNVKTGTVCVLQFECGFGDMHTKYIPNRKFCKTRKRVREKKNLKLTR